jgi:hypothetical protein
MAIIDQFKSFSGCERKKYVSSTWIIRAEKLCQKDIK